MNRLSRKIAAVALAVLVLGAVSAQAKEKKPKHKKHQDLSANPLAGVNSKQPDKELFDKAMIALKKGRFDVARLDLQTMLNTYPDSEYRMRAKLAVGDTWFKEGGTAALTQAEAEYKDFITFFPNAPEAAEAQMKVADIYYQQMEKPDRDYTNAQRAEQEYRYDDQHVPGFGAGTPRQAEAARCAGSSGRARDPDWPLLQQPGELRGRHRPPGYRGRTPTRFIPRAIRRCWESAMPMPVKLTTSRFRPIFPAQLKSGCARFIRIGPPQAYTKVVTRYPMAPHVEDARDRLVAMNRPVPEPTQEAIAESDAEERSRQPLHFTDKTFGIIKHGPTVVEAVHVGEPSLEDPKRTLAPDVTKENIAFFNAAINAGKPAAPAGAVTPTGVNEPPRSDQPSQAPLQLEAPAGGTGVGVQVVSAPAADPNAVVKPVGPVSTVIPAAEKPAESPDQVNDVNKSHATPAQPVANAKQKKPKADLNDESSSKKKKKKGISKLNPF